MDRGGLDRPLVIVVGILVVLGMLTLYSAGLTDVPSPAEGLWRRQLVWLGIGIVGAVLAYRISPRILEWATPFLYVFALLLLAFTLLIGTGAGTAAATKSWIAIGGVRLGQPAEVAKIATILMLARHFGGRREAPSGLAELMPSVAIIGAPFLLVALQPDLGSAIVFLGILATMLYWTSVSPWVLLLFASPLISLLMAFSTLSWGIWIVMVSGLLLWVRPFVLEGLTVWLANVAMGVVALALWDRLAPYQQNRLLSFLNPEIDPRATGWHIIQSKVAIGSGGLLGEGFAEGSQKRLAFLPAQHTDFVYSIVGEEGGFLWVLATLLLFAVCILILIRIARHATDPFSSMVVFGVAGMLLTHIVVNVGMTVGLMPITGIPLPFFSYGGSFLLACCLGIGMAMRVARESRGSGYAGL